MTKSLLALVLSVYAIVGGVRPAAVIDDEPNVPQERISIEIRRTAAGERILAEEVWLEAPVEEVWNAYATAEGWMAWAAPAARVDLRVGGEILTAYPGVVLGEEGTNRLEIVNYVPREVLTLKADLRPNWPEVMRQDADRLSNVILFEPVSEDWTRLRAYGMGYGDSPEYEALLGFFRKANRGLYENLIKYLEEGAPVEWPE